MAGFAWVTLATNDSYSLGALVLAHSLRRVGSKHDLAVLVTPGVTGAMREKLASVFSLVQEVNVLDSKDEANLALLARPELGITFTKLHCWRLTQYEKCVFVDADTLVIRNCDELFEREELSAAPDVGWPDCFNSGVFVFKPSQQTFASITSFAAAKGSFDGGDQGLLNQYFSDWAHKDISKHLPFIYNMCSTATYSYLPAFKQFGEDVRIIHFIGITKPWLQYFDTVSGQVQPAPGSNHLQPLLQLWWQIFCENVHPQLSPVMAGIAGALAKITLGEARSPEQVALEEHMRKQSWEQGQIDYMGRDSFDNIWKKISETLALSQRQPSPPKTLPELKKPAADPAAAVSTKAEPTAKKSEAAVLAEPQQKEDRDLTSEFAAPGVEKLIPPSAEVESQQISGEEAIPAQSSISDAAVPPVALLPTEPQVSVAKTPETPEKTDKETSALATTTTTLLSSIPQETAKTELPETPAAASTVLPEEIKTPECQKDQEIQLPESTSSQTVSDSPVPIQVAESVLEAEVKESVTEDLRPVTEEAISSISVSAQESVPAVLETVLQAVHPPVSAQNGADVLDAISEIGNGIDALTLSSPLTVTSAAVSVAAATPEVATSVQTEEIRPPTLETTQDVATSGQKEETSAPQTATVDEPKVLTETQQTTSVVAEIVPEAKITAETQQTAPLLAENVPEAKILTETQQTTSVVAENVPEAKITTETQQTAPLLAENVPEAKISTETQQTAPLSAESVPEAKISTETHQTPPLSAESVPEAKISTETQQTAPVSAESVPEATILPEIEKSSPTTEETVAKPEESKPLATTEISTLPPVESAAKPQEVSAEITQTTESAIQSVEKSTESKLPSETEKSTPTSAEASEKTPQAETPVKPDEPKVPSESDQQCPLPVSAAPKPEETKVPAKIEEPAPSAPQNLEQIQPPTKSEKPLTCPLKSQPKTEETSTKPQEKESSTPASASDSESNVAASAEATEAKVPKAELKEVDTSEEVASQSESSEESPVRPARTKDMQIPGTPTVIEATPPTSPPIGALESFDEQPTKTTKKVVKKVVKKTTSTESKPAEGSETEGEVKKVTKKVVKKVVKKTKEEDAAPGAAAETSSANDKPKKVVKVAKKTTKTGQTLEAETTVPETPPPGTSEIPVPPKRKLKTIGKSTPAKSDPES